MRRRIAVSLLLLFSLESTGCYAWHQDTSPVPKLQNAVSTDEYRITLAGGRVVQLTNVLVRHDSLLGITDSTKTATLVVGFPVTHVTRVERRSVKVVATVATVAASALLVGGLVGGAMWARNFRAW